MTIVVCTYRPRVDVLDNVLSRLISEIADRLDCSVLVVVNEKGGLKSVLELAQKNLPVRFLECAESGLLNARLFAIRNTHDDILFVDDDNVLSVGYVSILTEYVALHNHFGVVGSGHITLPVEYDVRPIFAPLLPSIAIRTLDHTVWANVPFSVAPPYGAGMFVRRAVLIEYLYFFERINADVRLGRTPTSLAGYEDYIFMFVSCNLGMGYSVNSKLMITHVVDPRRITESYFFRLVQAMEVAAWDFDRVANLIDSSYNSARRQAQLSRTATLIHLIREIRNIGSSFFKFTLRRSSFFVTLCHICISFAAIKSAIRYGFMR
jgi:hypothetical protein